MRIGVAYIEHGRDRGVERVEEGGQMDGARPEAVWAYLSALNIKVGEKIPGERELLNELNQAGLAEFAHYFETH